MITLQPGKILRKNGLKLRLLALVSGEGMARQLWEVEILDPPPARKTTEWLTTYKDYPEEHENVRSAK